MKIIFLEIEDVLNNHSHFIKEKEFSCNSHSQYLDIKPLTEIDTKNVKLLAKVIESTDAQIVLAGGWRRFYNFVELRRLIRKHHKTDLPIIGQTPICRNGNIGYEVEMWFEMNRTSHRIEDVLCLFGNNTQYNGIRDLIVTNPLYGFNINAYNEIVEKFNGSFNVAV